MSLRSVRTVVVFAATIFAAVQLKADFHNDISARLPVIRAAIPSVTAAAEAVADRIDTHRKAKIRIPEYEGYGLREELLARAGGLTQVAAWDNFTPDDIVLMAVRDWERQAESIAQRMKDYREEGLMVVLFASRAGMPTDIKPDFLIDNGAPDGSRVHGPVNAMVNITYGWLWCCEYAAAFSRKGIFPAITKSIGPADAWVYNAANNTPDGAIRFYSCPEAIPAGELASCYLNRFKKLLIDAKSSNLYVSIDNAAELIVDRLVAGRRVGLSSLGHFVLEEIKHDIKSPILGFRSVWMLPDAYAEVLDKDDVLVWLTYSGMNSAWADYGKCISESGVEIISSFGTGYPASSTEGHSVHIPQTWASPDAEIAIPVKPYAMAPVSCIDRVLIFRMLDDAVAAKIAARGLNIPKCKPLPYRYYEGEGKESSPGSRMFNTLTEGDQFGKVGSDGKETRLPLPPKTLPTTKSDGVFGRIKDKHGVSYWNRGETGLGDGSVFIEQDNKWGVLAADGSVLMAPKHDLLRLYSADTKLLVFINDERKFGLCSADGKVAVPAVYDAICKGDHSFIYAKGLSWGFMDAAGKELSPAEFRHNPTWFCDFNGEPLYQVTKESGDSARFMLCRASGEVVVPPDYNRLKPCNGDLICAQRGTLMKLISITNGPVAVKGWYNRIQLCTLAGKTCYRVQQGRRSGVLREDGSVQVPVEYEPLSLNTVTGVALGCKSGEWRLIEPNGTVRKFPIDCDFVEFMSANHGWSDDQPESQCFFRVAKGDKWGIADAAGKLVVPMEYSHIMPIDGNRAFVAKGGEWRLDVAAKPRFVGGKWGVVDAAGKVIVPIKYNALRKGKDADSFEFVIADRIPLLRP